ncbi:MAG TPA: efflux RND transporter periplasmic adaptor subunit [Terriglobia bacterium]|nr:efflux RND transporter periplasmic adaptor subunit [Terriglobia bacterium]
MSEPAPTVTVQVATVEPGSIEREVTADAVLYPLHQATIVPKISAPVTEFYVQRGTAVHAGQLLAKLESRDLAAAVTENQGAYEQAQAAYRTAVNADVPQGLQKAELDVKAAREALDAQQKVFDSDQVLFKQGAIPRKQLEDAGVALTQVRNQYEIAQKHLQALQSFANQDALKAAQGQLAAAEGRYEAARAQLSYAEIRSPIDGAVTDRPLYPGEMATPGSPLLTVMDLSHVVARAHLAVSQAALLKVGDPATLSVTGASGAVPAKLTLVSPALDPNSTTVEVWVEAANPRQSLHPGSSARVTIVAETANDALLIPAEALLTAPDGATSVIEVGPGNKPVQKPVKVGIRQGDRLQITGGLAAGDRVVTEGAYELSQEDPDVFAGTKLQIVAPKAPDPD